MNWRALGRYGPAARRWLIWLARLRQGRLGLGTGTPLHADSVLAPFFIVGSGRSGNTLLRAMLHAHPALAIPPESYVLGKVAWLGRVFRDDPWDRLVERILREFDTAEFRRTWAVDLGPVRRRLREVPPERRAVDVVIDAIYRSYMATHANGTLRWGDKTPINSFHLPWIGDVFPEARYIHMLRDGRDVAVSYVEAGFYGSLEDAGERWARSVREVRRFGRRLPPGRFIEVRYEALVRDPWSELVRVCGFLDVEPRDEMLEYWKGRDTLGDTGRDHHANVRQPVTSSSVGRWRTLSTGDRDRLRLVIGSTLREAGYPLSD